MLLKKAEVEVKGGGKKVEYFFSTSYSLTLIGPGFSL